MQTSNDHGLSVTDLEVMRLGLLDRIKRLESDLRAPLEADSSEQAGQLSNQMILRRLLEIERSNLIKVNFEIEKKKAGAE